MWFVAVHRRRRVKRRHLTLGSYLTDGQRLLRVTSLLVDGRSMLVSVENCLTLETHLYAGSELEAMRVRRVRAKHVETRTAQPEAQVRRAAEAVIH